MKPFVTPDSGQRTADTLKFTNHHLPITKSHHFKPSILAFFAASPQKNHRWKKLFVQEFTCMIASHVNPTLKQFLLVETPIRIFHPFRR